VPVPRKQSTTLLPRISHELIADKFITDALPFQNNDLDDMGVRFARKPFESISVGTVNRKARSLSADPAGAVSRVYPNRQARPWKPDNIFCGRCKRAQMRWTFFV
jgi:hypothetical protein